MSTNADYDQTHWVPVQRRDPLPTHYYEAHFGELLDFVEELPYVDYVTDFRMYHLRGGPDDSADVAQARATTPDAILVSDKRHEISPVP